MFSNFFKTTWRNLKRNKTFSILNIAGLAVGLACTALIFLWVEYNVHYNSSIPDVKNLYTVENNQTYGKDMFTFSSTPFRLKDALLKQFPGVKNASRYNSAGFTVSLGERHLTQSGAYVDSAFLEMFGLQMVEGNASTCMNDMSKIAISQKMAKSYFGEFSAIGKTLLVDKKPYIVSGVFKDIPDNVQFHGLECFISFQVFYNQNIDGDSWGNNSCETWVQLLPNASLLATNNQLKHLIKDNQPDNKNVLWLYPMDRLLLHGSSSFVNGQEDPSKGLIQYIKMFSAIACIILIIACINFMNLSTARSEKRAKEIGMRKVLGSSRKALIIRLLLESLIVSYIATFVSVILVVIFLPLFNQVIGIHLQLNLFQPLHILFLLFVGGICGLLAGSYPALYLSSFNPVRALKNQVSKKAGNASVIRKGLVVVQFSISVVIIVAVIIVYKQIQYTKNRDLGFNKENVLYVPVTPDLSKGFATLKQNILQTNRVSSVSLASFSPMAMYNNGGGWNWEGKTANEEVLVTNLGADNDYLKTFGIQLKEGHEFSTDPKVDSMNVIINESFAKLIGKTGHVGGKLWGDDPKNAMTIIGVMKDFVFNQMSKSHPEPLAYYNSTSWAQYIYIKLKPTDDLSKVVASLQPIFRSIDPSQPFDYHFVDKDFDKKFQSQRFVGSLATIFGGLAIFISCLGLFGLSAFMAEQRRKEVGVRKVLGASVTSVISLLSKDFLKLVVIACLIAFPIAYWLMNSWLQDYQYRITISWYIFLYAGVSALVIAYLTIYFQTLRAATMNPVKSLRSE